MTTPEKQVEYDNNESLFIIRPTLFLGKRIDAKKDEEVPQPGIYQLVLSKGLVPKVIDQSDNCRLVHAEVNTEGETCLTWFVEESLNLKIGFELKDVAPKISVLYSLPTFENGGGLEEIAPAVKAAINDSNFIRKILEAILKSLF